MLDQNLQTHCEEKHQGQKLVEGEKQINSFFSRKRKSTDSQVECHVGGRIRKIETSRKT